MTTPSTEQYDAWGVVCASLVNAYAIEPAGVPETKGVKVRQHVDAYLDAIATAMSISRATLDAGIEASAGYTNTGGTGAICA